MQERLF